MMFEMFESLIIEISQPLPGDALAKIFFGLFFLIYMKILISMFEGSISNNKENRRKQL